jgi:methanogenic corrinoid protein MtbC1
MIEPLAAASKFEQALLSLDRLAARNILLESGGPEAPLHLVEKLVVPALERIGAGWEQGQVALSQVYMSGRICEELVDTLLPPYALDRKNRPKMAIAVLQDYHLLGKRIVYSVLRASGFELLDYGRVDVDDLVGRVSQDGVEVLLISVLMLPSALRVKDMRARLQAIGSDVKIVVGGAPFRLDDQLWKEVGADAMGREASEAVGILAKMMGDVPWHSRK